ncbi:Uncharacterised protein [Mycobacterium tuberculosis]|nr:Uncharacterised protein [Mycobacterium tuberculosis]
MLQGRQTRRPGSLDGSSRGGSPGGGIEDDHVGRLVVCELVTNAYRHGEGPIVVRVLRDDRDGLPVIEVWDGPLPPPSPSDALAGRAQGASSLMSR